MDFLGEIAKKDWKCEAFEHLNTFVRSNSRRLSLRAKILNANRKDISLKSVLS